MPSRPGDVTAPADVPWGGAFGTVGPDAGYVLRLLAERDLNLEPGEHRHNVEAALAAVATARASHHGRAPIGEDVDVALVVFGYDVRELPDELVTGLVEDRIAWFANLAHDAAARRAVVASVRPEVFDATPAAVRARMATGRRMLTR